MPSSPPEGPASYYHSLGGWDFNTGILGGHSHTEPGTCVQPGTVGSVCPVEEWKLCVCARVRVRVRARACAYVE